MEAFRHLILGEIKFPWEFGLDLLCTASYGGQGSRWHCNNQNAYYALDFDRPWEGNIEPETKILAITGGEIDFIGDDPLGLLGLHVKINHGYGVISLYAHLKEIAGGISVAGDVRPGQFLGLLGETGKAMGPHLHFQLLVAGKCLKETVGAKPEPISGHCNLQPNHWYKSDNRTMEGW